MNFHLEVSTISRKSAPGKPHPRSIAKALSYISGKTISDQYDGKTYSYHRTDLVGYQVYLPANAPKRFKTLQRLCDEINRAEKRKDARTGRLFIGSLPNELPPEEWERIVEEFIQKNFTSRNLCAVCAIHLKRNPRDPSKDNPHAHIIVSTRTLGPNGFSRKKDREQDKRKYIEAWRKNWAEVQNRAYQRCGREERVSHLSLEVQEVNREHTIHLHISDWRKEMRGQRTKAGDYNRKVRSLNQKREQRERERDLTRSR